MKAMRPMVARYDPWDELFGAPVFEEDPRVCGFGLPLGSPAPLGPTRVAQYTYRVEDITGPVREDPCHT